MPEILAPSVSSINLRTGAWHSEETFKLNLPPQWSVAIHWPRTPPPLTESQIGDALNRPIGQPAIEDLCRGKSRPVVIVDDLNRPTPAHRILPALLERLQHCGIPARDVRILIATGTHGAPSAQDVLKKVGSAASECKIVVHDSGRNTRKLGRTSFGTLVSVNEELLDSDFVVGIGGVYPNQTAGFGGGSKLVLGVLGFRSIMQLHYRNSGIGWGRSSSDNAFRRDLDEIARMAKLSTSIAVHIDANRDVIRLTCGDPFLTYSAEAEFAQNTFAVPPPGLADVVICNAYPSDLSLTSVQMKGITPLERCAPGASRIVLASCPDGIGHHGLFPIANHPPLYRWRHIARRLAYMKPAKLLRKIAVRALTQSVMRNPIRLYRTVAGESHLPPGLAQFRITDSWPEILQAIKDEHPGRLNLSAVVYPCAPLLLLIE